MPFDPRLAAEWLGERARRPYAGPWPDGAPTSEYTRSPAAARVAELAARDGLFLFHYEHRGWLEIPEDWLADPELAAPPQWDGGVLPEAKYQSFRHDLPIGGFHPGHRAKWSTHELCHGLVGFGWRADATPFFHATAGRLAELLPVVLWYFLDEAHLRRCPDHRQGGALFRSLCRRCEAVAATEPDDAEAGRHAEEAARFLDRELAAITRSRREGRPIPHTWATLDLCSDGVAYAAAHGERLRSGVFREFAERFLVPGGGWSPDLDALEARVVEVARGLVGGGVAPLAPSPAHGRWRWTLQDTAWRLLTVRHQTEGEAAEALDAIVDGLAAAVPATIDAGAPVEAEATEALQQAIADYQVLAEEYVIPDAELVFAVGYDLAEGLGHALPQLIDGVRSGASLSASLLGENLDERVSAFAATDAPRRALIAERWADFLAEEPLLADLARYEGLLRQPPEREGAAALGAGQGAVRLAEGVAVVRASADLLDLAEGIEMGDYTGAVVDGRTWAVHGDGTPVPQKDGALLMSRDAAGQLLVLDVGAALADRLAAGAVEGTDPELAGLRDMGVLVPLRWSETEGSGVETR